MSSFKMAKSSKMKKAFKFCTDLSKAGLKMYNYFLQLSKKAKWQPWRGMKCFLTFSKNDDRDEGAFAIVECVLLKDNGK